VAKIEVNVNLLNSNFNSKNIFFIHILVKHQKSSDFCGLKISLEIFKSSEDRIATLHTFGKSILQISRNY
jgi:hypothetical protein